jgi:hypothetical protein
MNQHPALSKIAVVISACFAFSLAFAVDEESVPVEFPKDKPTMEIQFPSGFKTGFKADGSCLAVGPKTVMALVAMEKAKDAAAVKSALPDFAKSYCLRSLSFREINVLGIEDAKLPPRIESADIPAKILQATGKNSDGDAMVIHAIAFPWEHRYYVLVAVGKPEDKSQLETQARSVVESVYFINDD